MTSQMNSTSRALRPFTFMAGMVLSKWMLDDDFAVSRGWSWSEWCKLNSRLHISYTVSPSGRNYHGMLTGGFEV